MSKRPPTPNHQSGADWPTVVSELRERLAMIAVRCPKSTDLVEEALGLIRASQRAWQPFVESATQSPKPRRQRRGQTVAEYRIEPGERGLSLVEFRTSGAVPFRCPEDVYQATVAVLARVTTGISFDDLREAAMARLGRPDEPIYLFRVVLRFLKEKGLIQHSGRRFRPHPAKGFKEAAAKAWRETERKPLRP